MEKDKLFARKKKRVVPFEFNGEVTRVFDDMLDRSVPFYAENIQRQSQLAVKFYRPGTRIYDLGCSHGNLGMLILDQLPRTFLSMTAVDSSRPMVEKYRDRLDIRDESSRVDLVCGLLEDIRIKNASVVVINLTLQFLSPLKRDDLIKKIFQGMTPNSILLLTEKIDHTRPEFQDLYYRFYKRFKLENGYSELEISQKRDALEKVLVPETIETHRERIVRAGFTLFDVWLKWFNFTSMMAIKK